MKEEFKQTAIGSIPEDWKVEPVGQAFNICNNLRLPISEEVRKKMSGIYPYYGPTKVQDYINVYRINGKYALIGEDGDHFLKWNVSPMTQLVDGKFNVNNHAHIIKGSYNSAEWFYYYFKHRDLSPYLSRQGAGRYKLTKETLQKIPCALPPTEEQNIISQTLADADAWIDSLERLLQKKRLMKQGAMQELIRQSEGWELKKLGDVAKINKGQIITSATLEPGAIPVIAGGKSPAYFNAKANRLGKTITISASGASAGYVAFHRTPIFASDCSTVSEGSTYNIEFIYYSLSKLQQTIYSLQTGGAQPHVQPKDLYTLEILVPSISEQIRIANILSDMDAEIEALEPKLSKARQIQQAMMQQLLTGQIRLVKSDLHTRSETIQRATA